MVGLKHSPEVHEAPSLLSGDILRLASSSVGLIPIPDCLFLTSLGTRGRQPSLWGWGWGVVPDTAQTQELPTRQTAPPALLD